MFSKSRSGKPDASSEAGVAPSGRAPVSSDRALPADEVSTRAELPTNPDPRPTQTPGRGSFLAADLTLVGSLKTLSDLVIEGTVEGDIQAFKVTMGEHSFLRGEVEADDVTVWGRVEGQLSGLKVQLASTARVSGIIRNRILAIDAGARFEGTAQRIDADPAPQAAAPAASKSAALSKPGDPGKIKSPSAV